MYKPLSVLTESPSLTGDPRARATQATGLQQLSKAYAQTPNSSSKQSQKSSTSGDRKNLGNTASSRTSKNRSTDDYKKDGHQNMPDKTARKLALFQRHILPTGKVSSPVITGKPPSQVTPHAPVTSTNCPPVLSTKHARVPGLPSTKHARVPSTKHAPVPSTKHAPAPSTKLAPVPSTKHAPVTSTKHAHVPSTKHAPVPSAKHAPVPSTKHAPAPSTKHAHVPSTKHAPVPSAKHAPVPSTKHAPAPSTKHAHVPSTNHAKAVKRKMKQETKRTFTLQPRKKCFCDDKHQLQSHFETIGEQFEETRSKRKHEKKSGKPASPDQVLAVDKSNKQEATQPPPAIKPSHAVIAVDSKQRKHEESTGDSSSSSVVQPKRQVSLMSLFCDEEDDTTLDDSCVPMDVEMEDVEAHEVHDQLLQIRDKIGSATTTQPDSKILPETSQTPASSDQKDGLFIILDTNVLISHLTFLEELRDQSIKGFGKPILVVPWVVLQELDGLKTDHSWKGKSKSKVAKQAIAAGNFVYTCIKSHHPRVQGQAPQSALTSGEITVECNDDRVLQCCLQYQKMGKIQIQITNTILF
ncbi:uncharacterized protein [Amphiura filiformis]|uniref:uncharacterized protein n=1 Tax=Amphiura filiformis TaxID=82378 RepID=UPI003B221852